MDSNPYPRGLRGRRRGPYRVISGVAVFVSALVHVYLIQILPPLPVRRLPAIHAAHALKSMTLMNVSPTWNTSFQQPTRYHPENVQQELEDYTAALEKTFPEELTWDQPAHLVTQKDALIEPSPFEASAPWSPREAIMQIEETLYQDDVSALPRRYIPYTDRTVSVPDITLPTDIQAETLLTHVQPSIKEAALEVTQPFSEVFRQTSIVKETNLSIHIQSDIEKDTLRETASFVDESHEEITHVEPIERLLDLDLYTFSISRSSWHLF